MEEKRRVNVNKLIEVAKRNLDEMRTMFDNEHYYGTVNRAYYAMFHAVSALLLFVNFAISPINMPIKTKRFTQARNWRRRANFG